MIITFCGHSQFIKTAEREQKILDFLQERVGSLSAEMYLGGYGDFDSLAYECCKKYKATHPNVSLIFVTPYMPEGYSREHLEYLNTLYDEIIYPEIENVPPKFAIVHRNKWMIERSDHVICGIDHSWGGAYRSYLYAKKKEKQIFNVTGSDI